MQRWDLDAPRSLVLRTLPDPEPLASDVVVEIACTAVSPGTEVHAFRSGPTDMMVSPGYLAAGTVRAVGAEVVDVRPGDRVRLAAPHGSVAVVEAASVTVLPDDVDFAQACFTHLAGLGHYCLHAGDYRAGDDVAVIGLGLVGMCTAAVATLVGARVHALDVAPERLALATDHGFAAYDARDPREHERAQAAALGGIDVVVDTSGAWTGLLTAARVARKGTRISVLGVNRRPPDPQVGAELFDELLSFPSRFHYEGLRLTGCGFHPRQDSELSAEWTAERCYRYLLDMMATGRLDLGGLITDRIRPGELGMVMQELDEGSPGRLGIIVDWSVA